MRDVVFLRVREGVHLSSVLQRTIEILDQVVYAGQAVDHEVWTNRRSGQILIQSTGPGDERVPMQRGWFEAFAYTGFVTTARRAAAEVKELFPVGEKGRRVATDSPGGIACFFYVDGRRARCHIWSSHAGVEGVFVTSGSDCIAVSNRPLVSHLAGTQKRRPTFSRQWARRVLLAGSSLWDDTPFEGTTQPPPRTQIIVQRDEIHHRSHPVALAQQRYADRDPAGIEALIAAALESVSPLRRWARPQVQLSGGKDSRFVGALLRRAGIEADYVTFSGAAAGEGTAARAVASALGVENRLQMGDVASGDELLPAVLANLRRSDGLLAENRQLPFRALPHGGEPLVQGQAHHPRGGYRAPAIRNRPAMNEHLIGRAIGDRQLVAAELVDERRGRLVELLDGYTIKHPLELAYWLYNDWRTTRWLIASYRTAGHSRPLVWPFMDERVLRVVSELSTFDRYSEVAFYAALCRLHPPLAPVPLYQNAWKFDAGEIGRTEFPAGYESRTAPFQDAGGEKRTVDRRLSTIQPLFRTATRDLRHADELRSLIDPKALDAMSEHAEPAAVLDLPYIQVIQFMWKAVAIALVMEGSWLDVRA